MITHEAFGQTVYLREGTTDLQTLRDVVAGQYHVPPAWMPEPRSVLDLGANIGLTVLDYQSRWPGAVIEGVELDHENCRQAALNGVQLLEAAVVADPLASAGYDPSLAADAYQAGGGLHEPRARYTLAGLAHPATDFVKMDVEGMEWLLLDQKDWAPMVSFLLVELHGMPGPEARILGAAKLDALGFETTPSTHPAGLFAWRA